MDVHQIDRARTFAEIRRIEERVSRSAPAGPEGQRRAGWRLGPLAARRRRNTAGAGHRGV